MKQVLHLIKEQQKIFSKRPLFMFMRNKSIPPQERLAFVPQMSYFIMCFNDINNYYLREEETEDPIQKIVNKYTLEDADHWKWFLEDIKTLGFNQQEKFSNTLDFLWSEETRSARNLSYRLIAYAINLPPIQRVVLGEVMEATSHVFLDESNLVSSEFRSLSPGENLSFFGQTHHDAESSHTIIGSNFFEEIKEIELSEHEQKKAYALVHDIFQLFNEYTDEMLSYALKYSQRSSLPSLNIA